MHRPVPSLDDERPVFGRREVCVDDLVEDVGYRPDTPIETGVARFVDWYLDYYDVSP